MNEEWRDIEGYEGLYQVSNLGRVKSLKYNNSSFYRFHLTITSVIEIFFFIIFITMLRPPFCC